MRFDPKGFSLLFSFLFPCSSSLNRSIFSRLLSGGVARISPAFLFDPVSFLLSGFLKGGGGFFSSKLSVVACLLLASVKGDSSEPCRGFSGHEAVGV